MGVLRRGVTFKHDSNADDLPSNAIPRDRAVENHHREDEYLDFPRLTSNTVTTVAPGRPAMEPQNYLEAAAGRRSRTRDKAAASQTLNSSNNKRQCRAFGPCCQCSKKSTCATTRRCQCRSSNRTCTRCACWAVCSNKHALPSPSSRSITRFFCQPATKKNRG